MSRKHENIMALVAVFEEREVLARQAQQIESAGRRLKSAVHSYATYGNLYQALSEIRALANVIEARLDGFPNGGDR